MEWTSSEVVGIITYLLPGFVTAWVFYGLTAHPRREPFERVVQALIFTALIQATIPGVRILLEWASQYVVLGVWSREVAVVWSVVNAVLLGVVFSLIANKNWCHKLLWHCGITKRTSYPSEWYSVFNKKGRHVILHLEGGRRLHGWPEEWPDSGDSGHFVIDKPTWLLESNEEAPLHAVEQLVIPAKCVEMVEIMKFPDEITATADQMAATEQTLVNLRLKGSNDGKQVSTTNAEAGRQSGPNGQAALPAAAPTANLPAPTPSATAATKVNVNPHFRKKKQR